MSRRLLDWTPETGAEYFEYDEAADRMVIHREIDVEPILELNKALQNETNNGFTLSRDLRHIAEIPIAILHKWLIEDGIDWSNRDHWPAIKRKLRDPDYRWLKACSGWL